MKTYKRKEIIGDAVLYLGDCMEIMKYMPDGSVGMVLTDPPYKVTSRGGYTSAGGMMLDKDMRNGNGGFKNNTIKFSEWMPEVFRVLADMGHCYVFSNNKNLHETIGQMKDAGFAVIKTIVWAKNNKIMSQAYMSQTEFIVFARKGKFKKINHCGTSDLMEVENVKDKLHPSEKPVRLLEVLVENSSGDDCLVLDPFMGSRTTGLACANLGRKFIGIELEEKYFDIACKRIDQPQPQGKLFAPPKQQPKPQGLF